MKKLLHVILVLVSVLQSQASQLALIGLGAEGWGGGRLPADWQIKVKDGRPEISICPEPESCIRLKSNRASFGLERKVRVNLGEMPYLTWNWKVTQIPKGGDFRRASTDDQAAQLLVAFEDNRVISYIWDTTAPKGMMQSASSVPMLHVFAIVCQSGTMLADRWIRETHNVAADYERAYKKPAPLVKGLRIQINSQHTGTIAESYFGDVAFRSTPAE